MPENAEPPERQHSIKLPLIKWESVGNCFTDREGWQQRATWRRSGREEERVARVEGKDKLFGERGDWRGREEGERRVKEVEKKVKEEGWGDGEEV